MSERVVTKKFEQALREWSEKNAGTEVSQEKLDKIQLLAAAWHEQQMQKPAVLVVDKYDDAYVSNTVSDKISQSVVDFSGYVANGAAEIPGYASYANEQFNAAVSSGLSSAYRFYKDHTTEFKIAGAVGGMIIAGGFANWLFGTKRYVNDIHTRPDNHHGNGGDGHNGFGGGSPFGGGSSSYINDISGEGMMALSSSSSSSSSAMAPLEQIKKISADAAKASEKIIETAIGESERAGNTNAKKKIMKTAFAKVDQIESDANKQINKIIEAENAEPDARYQTPAADLRNEARNTHDTINKKIEKAIDKIPDGDADQDAPYSNQHPMDTRLKAAWKTARKERDAKWREEHSDDWFDNLAVEYGTPVVRGRGIFGDDDTQDESDISPISMSPIPMSQEDPYEYSHDSTFDITVSLGALNPGAAIQQQSGQNDNFESEF